MLTPHQIELVKATVPVLQAHGVDLTKHFYARMLSKNPELRNVFNQAHQARGAQQQATDTMIIQYLQILTHVMWKLMRSLIFQPHQQLMDY